MGRLNNGLGKTKQNKTQKDEKKMFNKNQIVLPPTPTHTLFLNMHKESHKAKL